MIIRQSDAHAWAEALIGGQWRRVDPTAAVAPSRIERGLGAALPASEFVPMLARLDGSLFKDLQLAWDAFNYDWRRHVIGLQLHEAALVVARLEPGPATAGPWSPRSSRRSSRRVGRGDARGASRGRGAGTAIARGCFGMRLCRRLAHAGLPRQPPEGPLAYGARASARWPEFAVAFQVIADSYAQLRYGPAPSTRGAHRRRDAAIARLARAIDVLPAPAALRALQPQ